MISIIEPGSNSSRCDFRAFISKAASMVALIGAIAVSMPALAADNENGAEADDVMEEIIITARKIGESLQDVSISVKAIGEQTLRDLNADSFSDIGRLIPSVAFTERSRGSNNINIRGLGATSGVSTVAIYNDGIIAGNRIQGAGNFAEADPSLFDIASVQVLRGPQGTLWGEGSFGGTILVTSNKPNASEFEGSVSATYTSVKKGTSSNFDVSAMINIPIVKDKLALRLVGTVIDHDGYLDAATIAGILGEYNTDETTNYRAMLSYQGENVGVTLIYKSQDVDLGGPASITPNTAAFIPGLPDPAYTRVTTALDDSIFETDEGILDITWDFGFATLNSVTGRSEVNRSRSNAVLQSLVTDFYDATSQELHLSSNGDGALNWIVGGFWRDVSRENQIPNALLDREVHTEQWSIFGQAYYDLSDSLTATLGLRYFDQKTSQTFFGVSAVLFTTQDSGKWDDLSPKFSLDWRLTDSHMVYGSVAKGYRAGGLNTDFSSLFGGPAIFLLGEPFQFEYDPDKVWNYEIGAKTQWLDGRLTINSAVFYVDWSNMQADGNLFLASIGTGFTINQGDAHSTGIEADISFDLNDNWSLNLGGHLIEAELDSGSNEDNRLANSTKYFVNASLVYDFQLGIGKGLNGNIRADYSITGDSFSDNANLDNEVAVFPVFGPLFFNERTPKRDVLNLRIGVGQDNWDFQVFATNVLNEYAPTWNFFIAGISEEFALLRPRTVGVNVKFRF